ncbi:carboxypeptidase-like regulatory domain-containing protein [Actinoplanes couchii]|uniref:alpha-amylase n=1 Tax=Actinoplanes couchii TaxID=403638 RepID=A0ABQ3XBX2_9ACTN|nr:carboxypeptidase-like regulatory domain-containing protein [Actinoplanes couchii]MDR6323495.1 hypothetical protein [Actinoplanes couchii]GID56012.1 hypothetical protein Aco03nite_044160 [Actinoplanes couchii]
MTNSLLGRLCLAAATGLLATTALAAPAFAAGAGTVQGVFTTAAGAPIDGAMISIWNGDGSDHYQHAWTDAAGHYETTVPAGDFIIAFDNDGLAQWSPGRVDKAAAQVYTVADGATRIVDEQQLPLGTISGVVTDPAGAPASGAHVRSGAVYGSTGSDGSYALTVFAGAHQVSFQASGGSEQWAPRAITPARAGTYTVVAGGNTRLDEQLLGTGTVVGHVTRADGTPLSWGEVVLYQDGTVVRQADTNDDGDYVINSVFAGDYTVAISTRDGARQFVPGIWTVVTDQTLTVDGALA